MNEFLRQFIMTGIRDMIARGVALYQTYQYSSGWFSKGVLFQEDLEEIQKLYEEKENEQIVEEIEEDLAEEIPVEENIKETPSEEVLETPTESEV